MVQTPLTSAAPYCTPAALIEGRDRRQVADLCSDDGDGPRPTYRCLLDAGTPPGQILLASLSAASWDVESACVAGGRYTPADLQALTGVGRAGLVRLTAALAFWRLMQRRHPATSSPKSVPGAEEAADTLERLRTGERVFPFQETADAGVSGPVVPAARRPELERFGRLFGPDRTRGGC